MVTMKMLFFVTNEGEDLVHLGFFDLAGREGIGQLGCLGLDSQRYGVMVKSQMVFDPVQVHPTHIRLEGFLAYFFGISPGFGVGRVLFHAVMEI